MENMFLQMIAALLFGYLLGSIPFGLVLTRLTGGGDLREQGSGNIGATNVLRTGGKWLGALTLLLDVAKGAAAVLLAGEVSPGLAAIAGIGAFLGHLYPVWLGFSGGKGVATLLGVVTALNWIVGVVFAVVWIGTAVIFRFSSLAGLLATLSVPISAAALGLFQLLPMFLGFALLVLWKHRANIERLVEGTEPRIGSKAG